MRAVGNYNMIGEQVTPVLITVLIALTCRKFLIVFWLINLASGFYQVTQIQPHDPRIVFLCKVSFDAIVILFDADKNICFSQACTIYLNTDSPL